MLLQEAKMVYDGLRYKEKILIVGVIIFQLILCVLMGTQKKSFFCDEIYSYGLANSEAYTFIDPETAKQYAETGWVDRKYFEAYLQVSKEVPFSFKAAFENQKNDVHPPLYYCFLHVFSLLNKGIFTKWTGLSLNLFFLVLTDILILYIAYYLMKDIKLSLIALILWSFSGAGFSNILLIRMYVMLTCEMLAYVAVHIRMLEKQRIEVRDAMAIMITVACGGLTHYYFYVLAFCFSAPICIYFLVNKEIRKLISYGVNICAGGGIALCIFPAAVLHVFGGYRGTEVFANLALGRDENVTKTYLQMINDSLFAGKFGVCLKWGALLIVIHFLIRYIVKIKWTYDRETRYVKLKINKRDNPSIGEIRFVLKNEMILEFLIILSYGIFFLIAVQGSNLVHNRYIFPIYPIIAVIVTQIIDRIMGMFVRVGRVRRMLLLVIALGLCKGSLVKYRIDFMYDDYDVLYQQAQETKETDCLLYYGDQWLDVYTLFPLRMLHDETYFLRSGDMDDIAQILSGRTTANELTVCLPAGFSEEDTRRILEKVIAQTELQTYRRVYQYEYLQEWLLE